MTGDGRPNGGGGRRVEPDETRRRLDDILAVLSDRRRRDLLYHLVGTEVTDVDTLTRNAAAMFEQTPAEDVPSEIREQVRVELVHSHLPKLADVGVIEFDPRSEAVRYRDVPPVLGRLLEACRDAEVDAP